MEIRASAAPGQTLRVSGHRLGRDCLLLIVVGILSLACHREEDRADTHLRRAAEFIAENRPEAALIELRGASQLRPDDADLCLRIADLSLEQGFYGDAADFYREALTLRLDDSDIALKLALVLANVEPLESEKLADKLLEEDPENARAWLVRARSALARNGIKKAMRDIEHARKISPGDPEVEWVLTLLQEARHKAARIRSPLSVPSPRVSLETLRTYDRYLQKGGEHALLGLLGRARSLARISNRRAEAHEAYRLALDHSDGEGDPYEELRVAKETLLFAQQTGETELSSAALERWLTLAKEDLGGWKKLLTLETEDPEKHREEVLRRLLDTLPDDPAAHGLYAAELLVNQGYRTALEHLEAQAERGIDEAGLLEAEANIQNLAGRPRDAAVTVARLKDLFPDRPDTLIMEGYQQVLVGEYDLAVSSLRTALAKETSPRAYRILARAEQQRGNLEAALEAISRATTLESDAEPDSLRLRALIEFQSGLYMDAAANLLELYRLTGLESADQLLLARCYYENKTPGVGRKLLLSLLGRDGVGTKASLEFAKRDASNPRQRPVIRKHLLKAHEKFPNNLEVLETITKFDLEEGGLHDEIIERLNAGVDRRSWLARPYLIRGRAMLALDHPLSARDDAERALRLDPATTEEAYEILFAAYLAIGNLPEFIQSMEARKARSGLNENRTALLARLHLSLDNAARASELYEEAITRGSGLVFVKNDLAFLLAQSGRDLDRALSLARAATDAPGEHLTTADTLGYVYLKRGQADAAIWQFRHVINEADPPVADYHYHLGLALLALKREAEALESFDRALAINPGFAEAAAARRDLVGEGQRIGSPEDNSS